MSNPARFIITRSLYWADSDAEQCSNGGIVFKISESDAVEYCGWDDDESWWRECHARWFLPNHGIWTSECKRWVHYLPVHREMIDYCPQEMRDYLSDQISIGKERTMYTPTKKAGPPTNRGMLVPKTMPWMNTVKVSDVVNPEVIQMMNRGDAGKIGELVFGMQQQLAGNLDGSSFGDLNQDMKGNDFIMPDGSKWQIKTDRGADKSGNLWVQTHTRTKDTNWVNEV